MTSTNVSARAAGGRAASGHIGPVLRWLLTLQGVVLIVLGALFVFAPEAAEQSYGVLVDTGSYELHYALAAREVLLGPIIIALAWRQQIAALRLIMFCSIFVALADLVNVLGAGGSGGSSLMPHVTGIVVLSAFSIALYRVSRVSRTA
ncbi:DUF4267 domain-containing protein [Lentzea sp. NPDC051208]|uniref:DUF4267 domain-containing protein n=1 Tax=Lentzea sp. NPDC051208 TaxID=3154642 RepID=UPI003424D26C